MLLASLTFSPLAIPFTTRFRHASADRAETSSAWVEARTSAGAVGYGESCPRPYVTGEDLESAARFFSRHEADVRSRVTDVATLRAWTHAHAAEIDEQPAAWCAIELAVLDALARSEAVPVEHTLGLPALGGPFRYSAVLGDADLASFERQAARYVELGFRDFKVKVTGDAVHDRGKLAVLAGVAGARVRIDANNAWRHEDAAIAFLRGSPVPLVAVEEPLGAGAIDALARVAEATGVAIVLDESLVRRDQIAPLGRHPERWIANVRVSKMGGLLRALAVVDAARAARVQIVVGAQVGETSLLTRAALTVAEAAGPALVAQEGAFGTHLLSRDVCEPPLMFGPGGVLRLEDHPRLLLPGFGVSPR